MIQLSTLIETFETLWPVEGAEAWDAPGLILGSPDQQIRRVLLTVDVTNEIVAEATEGFDLVLSHHPFLMRGTKSVAENTAKGSVIAKAIRANLAVYAAHTNADIVENGVSDTLAKAIGLSHSKPLVSSSESTGHGRIAELKTPMSLGDFARVIARTIPATASGVRVSGDYNQIIKTVAVCAGAGDSFIEAAVSAQADVYVTSDLRHHVMQEAREMALVNGGAPALIDISHWAAEWLWLEIAAEQLSSLHSDIEFVVSDLRTDPIDFVITQ